MIKRFDDLQSDIQDVDTFDIVSNVSTVLSCHENQIVSFEYLNDNEKIDISTCDSFESKTWEYNEEYKEELQQQLEFSSSPIDEQKTPRIIEEMSIISIPTLETNIKQHMSSCKVYEDHHFIDESTFIEEQDCLLNELEMSCRVS